MAEANISIAKEQFDCSLCLDLLQNPVTTPCGHNFCMECINAFWDQEDKKRVYMCPHCRETFFPRPVLSRNNVIDEVVEKLKRTDSSEHFAQHDAEPGDVECDFCTGPKRTAVKSCLVCLVSLCEDHFKPHLELPALKNHKVVKASTKLQDKICSQHGTLIDIYCRTDQKCICYLCTMHDHRGHDLVPAVTERSEKERQLNKIQTQTQQRIQNKEQIVQELTQAMDTFKNSAQHAVKKSEKTVSEIVETFVKLGSEITELIRAQEKLVLDQTEETLQTLEQDIADLRLGNRELEQLSSKEDHVDFIQSFQSCVSSKLKESSSITVNKRISFGGVAGLVSSLKYQVDELCKSNLNRISTYVGSIQTIKKRSEQLVTYQSYPVTLQQKHPLRKFKYVNE